MMQCMECEDEFIRESMGELNNNFMLAVTEACQPKPEPLRAITLKQIDCFMPAHELECPCEMCSHYEANKISQILQNRTEIVRQKVKSRVETKQKAPLEVFGYYKWILKHLMIPHNKIIARGLNIFSSEVVFYKDGEADDMFCSKEVEDPTIKRAHREKISNTFIQKIFGDRRRKYREVVQTFLGKKKVVIEKKPSFGRKKPPKKETKDAVVIRYLDGYEQLATENEFISMLQMRKQAQFWREIAYIKNFINVEDPSTRIVVVKYQQKEIKYEQLLKRARTLMRVYGQNILAGDRDYISDKEETQFSKALQRESLSIYAEYLLYKIVCFIELFYDERITMVVAKILINELGNGYLEDVFKLEKYPLTKFEWTHDTYMKKMEEHERKVIYSKEVKESEQIKANATKIELVLGQEYENMKEHYGLSNVEQDDNEQIANNEFFQKLYPDIQDPMSELLKAPGMTVEKFKSTYLGFKPSRKPIIRPFTSNMIRSLHKVTPQLHTAQPHRFMSAPKARNFSEILQTESSGKKLKQSKVSRNNTTAFTTPRSHF